MRRKILYAVLAIIAVATVLIGFVWRSQQLSAQATEGFRSAVVERGDMLVVVAASGQVRPAEQADLSFAASGQIAEVLVEVGDAVGAGDVLMRLETDRLALEMERARANVSSAEAQLARLLVGAQREEIEAVRANLRAAEAQLDASAAERDQVATGPRASQIAAAEAELASVLTQQKKAQDAYEATLTCVTIKISKGDPVPLPDGEVIIAPEDIEREICPLLGMPEEQARYRLEAANEALEAARARFQEVEAGADQYQVRGAQASVVAAAARRDAAEAQLDLLLEGATGAQIATGEARVAQARASLTQAELALEHAVLKAPFSAVVAAVDVSVGAQASSGLPVVTLVDTSSYHVNVAVDEMEVGRLGRGQTAELTFDALPDMVVEGTVQQIATAARLESGVVTYDVRINLAPTDAPIRADMSANATIIVEELSDVVKMPTWAVRVDRDTGQYYVHRRVGGEIERVDVDLGVRHEGFAHVLRGLTAGDEIVRVPESSAFGLGGG